MEQHDAGCDQDAQVGHDGSGRLFGRGADNEEAAAQQADPVVRRVHGGGADLHYYRAHEARIAVGLFAR